MSSQTATALRPGGDPATPVIIKTGGDGDPTNLNLVTITSDTMAFAEPVMGPTWVTSQSTSTGRLRKLKIEDGGTRTVHTMAPGSELASVTIKFGASQLLAMESGIAEHSDVLMVLTSQENPFSVSESGGDWNTATSTFPERITTLTLRVGQKEVFAYECKNANVTIRLRFD